MPRPKTGGRQKGTPNKDTSQLAQLAQQLDVDPFEILLLFASGDFMSLGINEVTPDQRLKAATEACTYLHPKRKALEHSGDMELKGQITVTVKRVGIDATPKR